VPEFWTLAEISKQYGTKRRTLLEWCSNGKWRGMARMEGKGGTKQWKVPDEVVKHEYKNQVIDAGNSPPALPPAEMIQASYEAVLRLAESMAKGMATLETKLEAAATREEAMQQEIIALREEIQKRRFRWPWQKH
jgi:hypothetical protein